MEKFSPSRLVIFGAGNIVSGLFDCASANALLLAEVILHFSGSAGERDIPLAARIAPLAVRAVFDELKSGLGGKT
jgi:hypothetical protein